MLEVVGRWKIFYPNLPCSNFLSIPGVGADVSHQGLAGINGLSIEGYSKKLPLVSVCGKRGCNIPVRCESWE